jgi:ATP-binding cassette, subfamily F, member 3
MLALQNLTLRRHTRTLLDAVSVTVHAGQRVGVVGKNGVGKSSLFAAIRGELVPDGGRIDLSRNVVVANVSQETPALDQPALDYALDGDLELRAIEARLRDLEQRIELHATEADVNALVEAHDRLTTIDGYGARARAAQLLHGLGFIPSQQ